MDHKHKLDFKLLNSRGSKSYFPKEKRTFFAKIENIFLLTINFMTEKVLSSKIEEKILDFAGFL